MRPLPCTILAVDTAANSGWAIWDDGVLQQSGECSMDGTGYICGSKMPIDKRHCVLVLERPWLGGRQSAIEGLGMARQAWVSAWIGMHGLKSRIVRVYPQTWRAALGFKRGEAAAQERERAWHELHPPFCRGARIPLPDEAAAICIGKWACYAPEVAKVLPKKLLAAGGFV